MPWAPPEHCPSQNEDIDYDGQQQHFLLWVAGLCLKTWNRILKLSHHSVTLFGLQCILWDRNESTIFSGRGYMLCLCLPRHIPLLVVRGDIFFWGICFRGPEGWMLWEKITFRMCVRFAVFCGCMVAGVPLLWATCWPLADVKGRPRRPALRNTPTTS